MRINRTPQRRRNSQAGVSMIELLIAGAVMVVGFMGVMVLVMTAIGSNNRNKLDSTATMLGQAVIEQINSTLIPGTSTLSDCSGTTFTINSAASTGAGTGAALSGSDIDFSQATPPDGYHMDFAVCNVANTVTTYDVRWNIKTLTPTTYLVTVGVKLKGASNNPKYFALPVTLRTYVGAEG